MQTGDELSSFSPQGSGIVLNPSPLSELLRNGEFQRGRRYNALRDLNRAAVIIRLLHRSVLIPTWTV